MCVFLIIFLILSKLCSVSKFCILAFLFWDINKVPKQFHEVTADHKRMMEALQSCDRSHWVAVYPPHITGRPKYQCDNRGYD